jgi:protein TonB
MTFPDESGTHDPPERPAYRVPIGLPRRDEGRRQGVIVSVLVHAAIIALLLFPIVLARTNIIPMQQGAGGAGPAGGGGGGRGGAQPHEQVQFIVPTTAAPAATAPVPLPIPVPVKVATPVPPIVPAPTPAVKPPEQAAAPVPVTSIAGVGAGAGTGNDGTTGNGPGTGGGVGSGIGTGRGAGLGPGTGGGTQKNFPPTLTEMFLPPFPVPNSVKGSSLTAEFDVDSTGRVLDVKFSETRDGDYNRRIMSVLRAMKFRPGHSPDGTPLRMKAQVGYDFGR